VIFPENLRVLPETRAPREHFKLVFGSGKKRSGQDTAAQKLARPGSGRFGVLGGILGGILGAILDGIARAGFSHRESALPPPGFFTFPGGGVLGCSYSYLPPPPRKQNAKRARPWVQFPSAPFFFFFSCWVPCCCMLLLPTANFYAPCVNAPAYDSYAKPL
jgi:hypothetical protein